MLSSSLFKGVAKKIEPETAANMIEKLISTALEHMLCNKMNEAKADYQKIGLAMSILHDQSIRDQVIVCLLNAINQECNQAGAGLKIALPFLAEAERSSLCHDVIERIKLDKNPQVFTANVQILKEAILTSVSLQEIEMLLMLVLNNLSILTTPEFRVSFIRDFLKPIAHVLASDQAHSFFPLLRAGLHDGNYEVCKVASDVLAEFRKRGFLISTIVMPHIPVKKDVSSEKIGEKSIVDFEHGLKGVDRESVITELLRCLSISDYAPFAPSLHRLLLKAFLLTNENTKLQIQDGLLNKLLEGSLENRQSVESTLKQILIHINGETKQVQFLKKIIKKIDPSMAANVSFAYNEISPAYSLGNFKKIVDLLQFYMLYRREEERKCSIHMKAVLQSNSILPLELIQISQSYVCRS